MAQFMILLYLMALLVRPQDWFEPVMGFPTGYVITLVMFSMGMASYLSDRPRYAIPHNRLLPAYVAFIFLSTLVETNAASAIEQSVVYLQRAVACFSIVWLVNTRSRVKFTIWCLLFIVLFLAYQAILEAQTGMAWGGAVLTPGYTEIRVRWHGDWDGPNVFAILFIVGIAFSMEMVFGPYGAMTRLMGIVVTSMGCVAIFFTNSRGAVLALLAMSAFYFKDRFSKPVAIGLVCVVVVAMSALGPSRMGEMNSKESSARERSWAWEQGLQMLAASPVFGVGRGEFYKRVDSGLLAHNNYVQNFAELGIPGFFLFLALLWFCWKAGHQLTHLKRPEKPYIASMGRMIQGVIIGYGVVTFFVVMELELLYFVFGLSMAMYCVARREEAELPELVFTRGDTKAVLGLMALIFTAIWLIAVKGVI